MHTLAVAWVAATVQQVWQGGWGTRQDGGRVRRVAEAGTKGWGWTKVEALYGLH
jgi:hypothetical protein